MEVKAYIDEAVGVKMRERAFKRFGYFKGSISKAVEESIIQWLSKNERIDKRLNLLLEKASKDPNVIAVLMFGSFAAGKTDYHDVDLAFLLTDEKDELSILSEYDDLREDPNFDISCLNSLAISVKEEVLAGARILLCKDKSRLYDFMIKTLKEYEDFKHVYELMIYGRNR